MSNLDEVDCAVNTLFNSGNTEIVLLHCVSEYPADAKHVNLKAMQTLSSTFGLPVGFSDHTQGIDIPIAAVALGACVIEKHFTIDKSMEGPDHAASLEPEEFHNMVTGIRKVEAALGNGVKKPTINELNNMKVVRKSLVASSDLSAGTILQRSMIAIKRPGTGLPPFAIDSIIGRELQTSIQAGCPFTLEMFKCEQ